MEWIILALLAFFAWCLLHQRNRQPKAVAVQPPSGEMTMAQFPPAPPQPIEEVEEQPAMRLLRVLAKPDEEIRVNLELLGLTDQEAEDQPKKLTKKADLDAQMRPYRDARSRFKSLLHKAVKAKNPVELISELDEAIPKAAYIAETVAQFQLDTCLASDSEADRFFDEVIGFLELKTNLENARADLIEDLFFELEEQGLVDNHPGMSTEDMERTVRIHLATVHRR